MGIEVLSFGGEVEVWQEENGREGKQTEEVDQGSLAVVADETNTRSVPSACC